MRTAARPNQNKKQVVNARTIPAPIGGWDAQSPLAAMPPQNAIILDNWIPRSGYCEIRRGYIPQQTGTPGPVESMMAFRGGPTGDSLFAAADGNLYDVTTQGAPLGSPVYSGATSNRWNYTSFANAAGEWLIAVNGVDTPIGYNAGTWATLPTITGSSGPITLNPNNLYAVTPHQGRLLFTEANSLHVWFPAAGAVGGAMQLLDLGSVFSKGGRLIGVSTWSWQFGVTADEYAVFLTDQGQIALYAGIDPSQASDWALTGVYNFGPPIGPKALLSYGADLVIITTDGIIPLSQALKLDRTQDNTVALTSMIKDAFSSAVRAYSMNYGWQGILYPGDTTSNDTTADGGSLGIFNIPITTLGTSEQYVSNLSTGAWCRFVGINSFCWEIANNAVYFGSTNGVYQWDIGADDNGEIITAESKSAFSSFGLAVNKQFTMIRPLLNCSAIVQPAVDIDVEYQNAVPVAQPTVVDLGQTVTEIRFDWTSVGAIGYVGAPHMVVSVKSDTTVNNIATDAGLMNTLGVDAGDELAVSSGLPYSVPVQHISYDLQAQTGGQL
jgi:hypothetical protein